LEIIEEIPKEWNVDADFQTNNHYIFEPLFSEEQCDEIISIGDRLKKEDGSIRNDESAGISVNIRKCKIAWIPIAVETKWIFEWIYKSVQNTNHWKLDIRGFHEALQYTIYDSTDAVTSNITHPPMYNWHTDTGRNMNYRKISLSVQLSNPDEYSGGTFELDRNGLCNEPRHLKKGNAIMFPSLLRHRVLPITGGIRKSLVVWIAGPHIK
jgi:hypothetical protein